MQMRKHLEAPSKGAAHQADVEEEDGEADAGDPHRYQLPQGCMGHPALIADRGGQRQAVEEGCGEAEVLPLPVSCPGAWVLRHLVAQRRHHLPLELDHLHVGHHCPVLFVQNVQCLGDVPQPLYGLQHTKLKVVV